MNTWRDPGRWAQWIAGDACPICEAIRTGDAVAELETVRVMMPEDGPMRGYVWLPFRRHVIELHELTEGESAAFMRDLRRVSEAVAAETGAVKLNWEIHGNTVPHLHVHLFPRYEGDPFVGRPIDPKAVTGSVYDDDQYARLRGALSRRLAPR